MTALSPTHGSRAQFFIGTPGTPGTASFEISQYLRNAGVPFARDKAEVTAFRATNKAYIAGLTDCVIPLDGPWDVNVDGNMYGLFTLVSPANTVAYQYGPTGIGSGLGPLYSGLCFMDKYEIKSAINAPNDWTGSLQTTGTPSRTIQ